jgi:hypothetical protein
MRKVEWDGMGRSKAWELGNIKGDTWHWQMAIADGAPLLCFPRSCDPLGFSFALNADVFITVYFFVLA